MLRVVSRQHRRRYHGALDPRSQLRAAATAWGRDADLGDALLAAKTAASPAATAPGLRTSAHCLWAKLIARLFLTLPLFCPRGGSDMRITTLNTQAAPVRRTRTPHR